MPFCGYITLPYHETLWTLLLYMAKSLYHLDVISNESMHFLVICCQFIEEVHMPPPFENMLEREVAHVLVHTELSESTQFNGLELSSILKAQLLAPTSRSWKSSVNGLFFVKLHI